MPPKMMLSMDAVGEAAEPETNVLSNEELVIALIRQHLHHYNGGQPVADSFEAAYPRHDGTITTRSVMAEALGVEVQKGSSVLDALVAACAKGPKGGRKFEFLGDHTSVDVNGLRVSTESHAPFAPITNIDELDFNNAQLLGRGASGSVMLVVHQPTGISYAVKEIALTEDTIQHAQAEISVVWGSSGKKVAEHSRYLVRSFGVFYRDVRLYIVMERMACSVIDLIANGPVDEDTTRCVVYFALKGLQHMHESLNQTHRDIKPHNLLVGFDGAVKLTDFGISSAKLSAGTMKYSTFCGTLKYMSPTRAAGEEYGHDGDVWGLGISAYQLLMGVTPAANNVYEVAQFAFNPPRLPAAGPSGAPFSAAAQEFLAACLQPNGQPTPRCAELLQYGWLAGIDDVNASNVIKQRLQS